MVTETASSTAPQLVPVSSKQNDEESTHEGIHVRLDFEKQGSDGLKEELGVYQRISTLTCLLGISNVCNKKSR